MAKKKYDPQYIAYCEKRISGILNDKAEYDEWTQICLSVQDAVQAATTIWGGNTDEEKHALAGFIRELVASMICNVQNLDITFQKREITT